MFNLKKSTINLFLLLALAIFSIVITRSHTPYGAAMSMDSLSYLSAAQQITLGHGVSLPNYNFGEKDFTAMTVWPPLYPITLSALIPASKMFNDGADMQIAWINAFALFVLVALFWLICKKFCRNEIAFIAALLLAFLPSMQVIYIYGWSETIFIPVVLLAFYFQWKFFGANPAQQANWLYASILVLVVAFYIRYAGLGFFGGFLACIFFAGKFNLRQRLQWLIKAVIIFACAIAPLFARNYLLTSTPIGHREKATADLLDDLDLLGYFLKDEFFPFTNIFLLLIPVYILYVVISIKKEQKNENKNENHSLHPDFLVPILSFIWVFTYLLFLIINRQLSVMDLDPRMIGPTIPFIILGISVGLGCLTKLTKSILVLLPFVLLVSFLFFRSYAVHTDIIASWKSSESPGVIQNIEYKTVLNQSTKPVKQLQKSVSLPPGALLLTDIEPTSFVQYFFPSARVKLLPKNLTEDTFLLHDFTEQPGLVVLTKHDSIEIFSKALGWTGELFQIEGMPYFVLIKLPIKNH